MRWMSGRIDELKWVNARKRGRKAGRQAGRQKGKCVYVIDS